MPAIVHQLDYFTSYNKSACRQYDLGNPLQMGNFGFLSNNTSASLLSPLLDMGSKTCHATIYAGFSLVAL